ncbi:MAG: UDP-N-acetylmuramoyl-tripeptide--D-alanyl-D-alanine ligase [Endozoicomonas sp.]
MIRDYRLSELAEMLGGELRGDDQCVSGISIDSRNISPGDLFIAIRGPKFDGHAYLQQAVEAGAVAVLVQDAEKAQTLTAIVVSDTFAALGMIGQYNRSNFNHPVLAITGSCGKTSVKEMLAAICSEEEPTLATEGNLNNAFGAPLTLSRIGSRHGFAVIELGTSSPGEIQYIAELTSPDVSVITNAAEAHLDKLVSVEGVAQEKGFILDDLKPDGVAVLNLDDVFFEQWQQRATGAQRARKVISFSLENPAADCYASGIESTAQGMVFRLHISGRTADIGIAFWGAHQVQNACCAAAAAFAAGISVDSIIKGLENARPFQRRGQRYQMSDHSLVIDETYNANPRATLAALDQLAECQGIRVMVFGDMLDLGSVVEARHREVGEYARHLGIDYFAGYGPAARLAVEEFGEAGRHFDGKEALSTWVSALLNAPADKRNNPDKAEQTTVLVKGSRGMEMLDIVRTLVGPQYKGER